MAHTSFIRRMRIVGLFVLGSIPAVAQGQIAVLSSTVEEKVAAPGARYTAQIVISNPSAQAQTARIYQTDYSFLADGTSSFDDPGTNRRSNARWVAPQATRITVPANSRVSVPYAVSVPTDSSLKGTYWSTVMIEGTTQEAQLAGDSKQIGVGAVMRYAIQVATHIEATGERALKFDAPVASAADSGKSTLEFDLINTGERGYRPLLWVELFDAEGQVRAKSKQQRGLLYPGTSLHQVFEFANLKPGTYKAMVFADTGAEPVFAAQYTITW